MGRNKRSKENSVQSEDSDAEQKAVETSRRRVLRSRATKIPSAGLAKNIDNYDADSETESKLEQEESSICMQTSFQLRKKESTIVAVENKLSTSEKGVCNKIVFTRLKDFTVNLDDCLAKQNEVKELVQWLDNYCDRQQEQNTNKALIPRTSGGWEGKIIISEDFDDESEEINAMFYGD